MCLKAQHRWWTWIKTRSSAKLAALYGYKYGMAGTSGIILCARQFMNSLADSSLEEVKRAIEDEPFAAYPNRREIHQKP